MTCAPVLLIGFNRPDLTAGLINSIRSSHPTTIYYAVDGPRPDHPDDESPVKQVQALVKSINWPCTIKTLFRNENLGCARGVSEAITWMLSFEESGIILEDDIRPTKGFFRYATELLHRYRDDERIGMISGFNHYNFQSDKQFSYHFTNRANIWGWGTWARVGKDYSLDIAPYENELEAVISQLSSNRRTHDMALSAVSDVLNNKFHTWDTQFAVMLAAKHYLAAEPRRRLTGNVGAGDPRASHHNIPIWYDATHFTTVWEGDPVIRHPSMIQVDRAAILTTDLRTAGKAAGGLTFLGNKIPSLRRPIFMLGRMIERLFPFLFRIG